MNILVTGGAGFIGSHVAEACIRAGHRVVVLDNLSSGRRAFLPPEAVFHEQDLMEADLAALLRQENIEVINHHAAQISVQDSIEHPEEDARVNILGTLRLLHAASQTGVAKMIFASTAGVYGDSDTLPARETDPCRPVTPYAISKWSGERYLQFFGESRGLPAVVLRYSNVYGPRQNLKGEAGVVALQCARLLQGTSPIVYGDGTQTRDFVYVEDVARANLVALKPEVRGVFNVGSGRETTVNELTGLLSRLSGRTVDTRYEPPREGDLSRSYLNPEKIAALGWKPECTLETGLRRTLEYFKQHLAAGRSLQSEPDP